MKTIHRKDILRPVRIMPPAAGEVWELTTVTEVFEGETVVFEGQRYTVDSAAVGEYYGARIYSLRLLRLEGVRDDSETQSLGDRSAGHGAREQDAP